MNPNPADLPTLILLTQREHQRYEALRKLSVAEQGALIREMVETVPHKDDPCRLRESREGRAILKVVEDQEGTERQERESTEGKVADFQAFRNRRR